jgi:predicted HicB family RNase H-like nuclease
MLKYKGYLGRPEFDDEAGLFHGEVVGPKDVITFQSRSAAKIEQAFRDSIDDYLEFRTERGEETGQP